MTVAQSHKSNIIKYLNHLKILHSIQFILLLLLISSTNSSFADNSFYASINPIPQTVQQKMIGNSWHEGCPVSINSLSYLRMSYWGFDNKSHMGEMIINQQLAPEVIAIFKQLYEAHYPIEKMMLPEELAGGIHFQIHWILQHLLRIQMILMDFFAELMHKILKIFHHIVMVPVSI